MFNKATSQLYYIKKDSWAIVWNYLTGKSLILTEDLLEDYLGGRYVNKEHSQEILELEKHKTEAPNEVSIEVVSVHFDSVSCECSCSYCICPSQKISGEYLSHKDIVLFIKGNFPEIKSINISGPDNYEKYKFVEFASSHFPVRISVNVNINKAKLISNIPNVTILAGGSLNQFLKISRKSLVGINAFIVLPSGPHDYNKLLCVIPDLQFASLTLERDILDSSFDVEVFVDFFMKLKDVCSFEVSGYWERPVLNINNNINGPCKSYEGRSLSIHNSGYVSICGYTDDFFLLKKNELGLDRDRFTDLLKNSRLSERCAQCPIFGMCKGGCRILHSEDNKAAFGKQCELKMTHFKKWANNYLSSLPIN